MVLNLQELIHLNQIMPIMIGVIMHGNNARVSDGDSLLPNVPNVCFSASAEPSHAFFLSCLANSVSSSE